MYIIPGELLRKFRDISSNNYSSNGRHIETLGFLLGYKSDDNLIATDLILPQQDATCSRVDDKGKLFFLNINKFRHNQLHFHQFPHISVSNQFLVVS